MHLNHVLFKADITTHLDAIRRVCRRWGIPRLGINITVILRDPANDNMAFVLSDEGDLTEALRIIAKLQQESILC